MGFSELLGVRRLSYLFVWILRTVVVCFWLGILVMHWKLLDKGLQLGTPFSRGWFIIGLLPTLVIGYKMSSHEVRCKFFE